MNTLQSELFTLRDLKYRDFHARLMPTVDSERIIGVRVPVLRKFAKDFLKTSPSDAARFLKELPHFYYEENNLHAFLLEQSRDFRTALDGVNEFLPYIDNWATCDCLNPKVFKKDLPALYAAANCWCESKMTYTVRYGIKTLMTYFLETDLSPDVLKTVSAIKSDEYYVNMMSAWFFATALCKCYEKALPYFTENLLSPWVRNKAISKACDSFRINDDTKKYLKSLRRPIV